MTELRDDQPAVRLPAALVDRFRPAIPDLATRVTERVQHDVPDYSGPATGRRHRLISMAVSAAIHHFLKLAQGQSPSGQPVDDLFRRMGYGQASEGRDLAPLRSALRVATRECWAEMRRLTSRESLSAADLGQLGDLLFDYVDHLGQQVAAGYARAERTLGHDVGQARARLLDQLLAGAGAAEVTAAADAADWPVPAELVVMSVSFHRELPPVDLPDGVLVRDEESPAAVVCDAAEADGVARRLHASAPGLRVALSWPVPVDEAAAAHRWSIRALELVDRGVIAPDPVVSCRDHATQLWLHAEPEVRRALCQDLLQPLLAETPNSREILSETLLAWLESRDSAPAIAARLDVHPQTVRYRWKRINELFGESLHDPEFVVQVTMLLKASVPLWKAGDQSDFERFRATRRR
ncbi:helix-turn-helix domain-containing protein [Nocardioides pantholopis]|uniref:PucR family transcriptional regulator n=1 Tax=Nocardioides pantholopis TaxID=2483798 RepID=UPI000F08BFFE|nr:helix-turn-helix domain-containing protein [Nocardioides pantholopis]